MRVHFANREDRERRVAPVDRGMHVAGERGGGGAVDEPAHAGGLSRSRSTGRAAFAGVSRGSVEPKRAVRQPAPDCRGAEVVAPAPPPPPRSPPPAPRLFLSPPSPAAGRAAPR